MINGNVEVLPILEGLEKYGEYRIYCFAIRGRIIEVDLDENKEVADNSDAKTDVTDHVLLQN